MVEQYVAVIQAGGSGTRMIPLTHDKIPKPMLLLNGKPMIQWQIENICRYGIREFIIVIGHLGEKIKEYFGDGSTFGIQIQYIKETEPLGSGGALFYLKQTMHHRSFLLFFADIMFDIDLNRMLDFYEKCDGKAVLLVHPNSHPQDSDLIVLDKEQRVTKYLPKNINRNFWYDNLVNAGIYVFSYDILKSIKSVGYKDLEKDIIGPLIQKKQVFGYRTTEYVKDAGTISRFHEVCEAQIKGVWKHLNLRNKQKCVFLDRDGTVNKFCGLLSREDQFQLEDYAAEAIRLLNASEYLVIVVTNQPVVARGMCSIEDILQIHRKMQVLLGKEGAYVDDIVFCPHHPDKGFPDEDPMYKISCNCRKPAVGMIMKMAERYNIELSESYIVGDSTTDIRTGKNAGVKTVLVKTGQKGLDGKYDDKPDYVGNNLIEACRMILT